MFIAISVIHVVVSVMLVLVILLQTGKGSDVSAMFGGGGANTLFGGTGGATFMSKLTSAAAIIFMITCLVLAWMSARQKSITNDGALPSTLPVDQGLPAASPAPGPLAIPGTQPANPNAEQPAAPMGGEAQPAGAAPAAPAEAPVPPAPAAPPAGGAPPPAPAGGTN